ncbi:hypothetical protein V5F32_05080 [Xanthobacter oligotrophicus]|uniref:Uncharacterized protein n=2 Tax=Xanthobacter TaxID=279 RepID=A0A6C1KHX8_XANAU|nr:hypothetical protein [Xanthobacter autotrophicus]TLX43889.1 hypothetical protein FBQ73_07255 [Xanthobacter autotrophicus]
MVTFSERVVLMARELTRCAVDLGDEAAVMQLLQGAGFSSAEIFAGLEMAIDTARVERINDDILAGLAGGEWPGAA